MNNAQLGGRLTKGTDNIKEITDMLEQGIQDLLNSDKYAQYLNTMSKFYNYSFKNTMLIALQKPDATFVASFQSWKKKFKRNVNKGEKGIKIIAPSPYTIKKEIEKIDPLTQESVIGKDEKPVIEEEEITIPAFKVVYVFDVSQTSGKELPILGVDELQGGVEDYDKFFYALRDISPVPIKFEQIKSGAKGYYHKVNKFIAINENMSEIQTIKTAIHEIAHAKLHALPETEDEKDKKQFDCCTREVQAESVAYTVCQHFGIDTSDYSFAYVAIWGSGKDVPELKTSLKTIQETASDIISRIENILENVKKTIEK